MAAKHRKKGHAKATKRGAAARGAGHDGALALELAPPLEESVARETTHSTIRAIAPPPASPEEASVRVLAEVLEGIVAPLGLAAASPRSDHEHREKQRVALEVEIDLHTDSHFFSGLSGDVSEGGIFVQTYRPLAIGDEVALSFDLPDGRVEAHGKVRWHRAHSDANDPGFGIAFDALSEDDRAAIHAFCAARAPLYYDV